MIRIEDLEKNAIYIIKGRLVTVAMWDGKRFVGALAPYGNIEPVYEKHYLEGMEGTATPIRKLNVPAIPVPLNIGSLYALYLGNFLVTEDVEDGDENVE